MGEDNSLFDRAKVKAAVSKGYLVDWEEGYDKTSDGVD
jgi:hypothetical protein